jgi:hypothetical protein
VPPLPRLDDPHLIVPIAQPDSLVELKEEALPRPWLRGFFVHLLIGLIVLLGGGFLLAIPPDYKVKVYGAITFVVGWYFRGNGKGNGIGNGTEK